MYKDVNKKLIKCVITELSSSHIALDINYLKIDNSGNNLNFIG